ncbi:MAG: c-type cytochrome [Vicingus serpentipes]|nr:c-type cytochrome [Vicingus serpentipes]
MKKRTLSIVAFSAIFAFATLTSCGGGNHQKEVTQEETTTEEDVVEKVVEETVAKPTQAGADLFKANACVACHQEDRKIVGPSLKDIATGYTDNTEGLIAFLAGEGEAIIDPSQAAVMAPQIETTKAMSNEERTSIADYIMSTK